MTTNAANRIDGIDFWRGFALLTIFIDHLPENIFQRVTQGNFGFSDAAELFVFLSGASVALAYGSRFFPRRDCGCHPRRIPPRLHPLLGPGPHLVADDRDLCGGGAVVGRR